MKKIVLASFIIVLASLACMTTALPTLTKTPLASSTNLPTLTITPLANSISQQPTPQLCARVTVGSLNARFGPGYDSDVVGWFIQDALLTIRRTSGNWWLVSGHGIDARGRKARMSGFVKSDYVEICSCYVQSQLDLQRH